MEHDDSKNPSNTKIDRLKIKNGVRIRRARSTDTQITARIVTEALNSYGIEPDVNDLDKDLVTAGQPKSDQYIELVAEFEDSIVGVAVFKVKNEDVGFLHGLYVDKKFRGLGIGKLLLNNVITSARERGLSRIELETRAIFKEAVILYESTGWRRGDDTHYNSGPERTYSLDI